MRPPKVPFIVAAFAFVLAMYIVVTAQAETDHVFSAVSEWMTYIVTAAGFVALALGIGWGLFNQKKYDKQNETIEELNKLLDAKEKTIVQLRLTFAETEARLNLRIERFEKSAESTQIINEAIVSQNLQMKAILKTLRLSGNWEGHEEDVFRNKS